jgi:hypothetical protein
MESPTSDEPPPGVSALAATCLASTPSSTAAWASLGGAGERSRRLSRLLAHTVQQIWKAGGRRQHRRRRPGPPAAAHRAARLREPSIARETCSCHCWFSMAATTAEPSSRSCSTGSGWAAWVGREACAPARAARAQQQQLAPGPRAPRPAGAGRARARGGGCGSPGRARWAPRSRCAGAPCRGRPAGGAPPTAAPPATAATRPPPRRPAGREEAAAQAGGRARLRPRGAAGKVLPAPWAPGSRGRPPRPPPHLQRLQRLRGVLAHGPVHVLGVRPHDQHGAAHVVQAVVRDGAQADQRHERPAPAAPAAPAPAPASPAAATAPAAAGWQRRAQRSGRSGRAASWPEAPPGAAKQRWRCGGGPAPAAHLLMLPMPLLPMTTTSGFFSLANSTIDSATPAPPREVRRVGRSARMLCQSPGAVATS